MAPSLLAARAPALTARPARPARAGRASLRVRADAAYGMGDVVPGANQLEALKQVSKVVADTGDIQAVKQYAPVDSTTNPSLIFKAAEMPEYNDLIMNALASRDSNEMRPFSSVVDQLSVDFGAELLKLVPGRVSTECDAHLSYDTQGNIDKAYRLLDLYAKKGIDSSRIYIKMASTWEGIKACEQLEKEGICTNMTLMFSMAQAQAAADAGATLISPFVGRIMDWYKKAEGREFAPNEDPGVLSVQKIYKYYKTNNYNTIVMAASFRNKGEITELAGCDNITISPNLLDELMKSTEPLDLKLSSTNPGAIPSEIPALTHLDEAAFLRDHQADPMAYDKLREGIAGFEADQLKLEQLLAQAANLGSMEDAFASIEQPQA